MAPKPRNSSLEVLPARLQAGQSHSSRFRLADLGVSEALNSEELNFACAQMPPSISARVAEGRRCMLDVGPCRRRILRVRTPGKNTMFFKLINIELVLVFEGFLDEATTGRPWFTKLLAAMRRKRNEHAGYLALGLSKSRPKHLSLSLDG